ncbi:hypothetical protein [Achromobacter sp. UMC46]|uniref:hypothetical protein n=1 Tax=Achromobacter sp. UMC46 TaxID=1862319 RepID=UPI001602511D|nr:hypothetical protein [Achromobacter sp. UMC46]
MTVIITTTTSLKQAHQDYIAHLRARGNEITNYECPDCGGVIETQAAPDGESWGMLSTCPLCAGLHMQFTNGSSAHGVALPIRGNDYDGNLEGGTNVNAPQCNP